MRKIFYLGTCSTCIRIMRELDVDSHGFEKQDIRATKISEGQIDEMAGLAGSYESFF